MRLDNHLSGSSGLQSKSLESLENILHFKTECRNNSLLDYFAIKKNKGKKNLLVLWCGMAHCCSTGSREMESRTKRRRDQGGRPRPRRKRLHWPARAGCLREIGEPPSEKGCEAAFTEHGSMLRKQLCSWFSLSHYTLKNWPKAASGLSTQSGRRRRRRRLRLRRQTRPLLLIFAPNTIVSSSKSTARLQQQASAKTPSPSLLDVVFARHGHYFLCHLRI